MFWVGGRNGGGQLIAFGYMVGMKLEHGYLEDIMVRPTHQGRGFGKQIVTALIQHGASVGIDIISATFSEQNVRFYEKCGLRICPAGVWTSSLPADEVHET